jgi:hypothetical protein
MLEACLGAFINNGNVGVERKRHDNPAPDKVSAQAGGRGWSWIYPHFEG